MNSENEERRVELVLPPREYEAGESSEEEREAYWNSLSPGERAHRLSYELGRLREEAMEAFKKTELYQEPHVP
jgi:hypothetical protein